MINSSRSIGGVEIRIEECINEHPLVSFIDYPAGTVALFQSSTGEIKALAKWLISECEKIEKNN